MQALIAQTTYTVFGNPASESTFYFTLALGGIGLVSLRILADRLDRCRIHSHIRSSGGEVLDITWSPFGRGWFGDKDRVYEVIYRTKAGKTVTATCKTSMFSGVYWATDTAPDSFPSDDSVSSDTQCLSCGATMRESDTHCSKCGWSYKIATDAFDFYSIAGGGKGAALPR